MAIDSWRPQRRDRQPVWSLAVDERGMMELTADVTPSNIQRGSVLTRSVFSHKRHPKARPLGRAMGCLLCAQTLIHILLHSLQWCIKYCIVSACVITVPGCTTALHIGRPNNCWQYHGNQVIDALPAQTVSNAEHVSISWHVHAIRLLSLLNILSSQKQLPPKL